MAEREAKIIVSVDTKKGVIAVENLDSALGKVGKTSVPLSKKQLEELHKTVAALDKELDRIQSSFNAGLIDAPKKAHKEIKALEAGIDRLTKSGVNPSSKAVQRYQEILVNVKDQALPGVTKSSGRAGLALLDFTRIAEDSAFGIRGVANNINPAIQSFGRLKAETGSTGLALKAMAGSMLGPGGIMFAIGAISSLLIAFGPQIANFFKGAAGEVEKFRDNVREAMESLLTLKDVFKEFEASGADAAKAMAAIDLEIFAREKEKLALEKAIARGGQGNIQQQILDKKDQIEQLEKERDIFRELLDDHNALAAAQARLKALGIQPTAEGFTGPRRGGTAPLGPTPEPITRDFGRMQSGDGFFTDVRRPGIGNMPAETKETKDAMDELFSKLVQIQRLSAAGLLDPQQRTKAEIQAIRQGLEAMVAQGIDPTSEAFQLFLNQLDQAEDKATSFAERFQESFKQIAQVAGQATQVLGALFNSMHQSRMNEIERERRASIGSIDAQLKNEKLSEKQRTKLLEQRNAAEEAIRERTRAAQKEQAERQKVIALFQIAMNTASAIVEALPNIPLSIIVGALGAIQGGIVATTPVPEFARGVTGFRGGMATVGERGREMVTLPSGSNVLTNENTERFLSAMDRGPSPGQGFSDRGIRQDLHATNATLERMASRMDRLEVNLNISEFDENYARYQDDRRRLGVR